MCSICILRESIHIFLHKSVVVHAKASFNNTIITIIYVWGWVVSLSMVNTCGFKDTSGTPIAAQTAAANAIHRAKVIMRVYIELKS